MGPDGIVGVGGWEELRCSKFSAARRHSSNVPITVCGTLDRICARVGIVLAHWVKGSLSPPSINSV